MTDAILVVTTTSGEEEAAGIARTLVEARLAACVQVVGPVASTYRWRGVIEDAREWQVWAKTRRGLFEEVEDAIRGLHSYDEPEILAVAIVGGSRTYLAWLESELKPPANVSGRQ